MKLLRKITSNTETGSNVTSFKRRRLKRWLFGGGGACLVVACIVWYVIPWLMSLPESFEAGELSRCGGAVVYDRHEDVLSVLPAPDYYKHIPLSEQECPTLFANAVLAAEDKRFYSHHGVDILGMARSVRDNILHGEVKSGASTITQQLVKISSDPSSRTWMVKLREILLARRVEMMYDKQTILNLYLNRLDFGNLCRGPQYAARYYFGKELNQLSLAESALLAGLPLNPSYLNPFRHADRALVRRNRVLDRMLKFGMSDRDAVERAKQEPLLPSYRSHHEEYLIPHLSAQMIHDRRCGEIHTTIDTNIQRQAYEMLRLYLQPLLEKNVRQAAILVVDNKSGDILCSVGSADRSCANGGLLDGTRIYRSAGSCLKPFVYALGFQAGLSPSSIIPDIPMKIPCLYGIKLPSNYNKNFSGPISIRRALASSQNIPAMTVLGQHGGATALVDLLRKLGFQGLHQNPEHYGLGLAIGNAEVRLFDVVRAYVCLASDGYLKDLRIEKSKTPSFVPKSVLDSSIAYMLTDILADENARVSGFGYGELFRFPFRCAFKTGTSSDYRDNWCIGYTKDYTVGVWVGNFDFSRMLGVSGISGAGPIFANMMRYLHRDGQATPFEKPCNVQSRRIDQRTGYLVDNDQVSIPPSFLEYDLFVSKSIVKSSSADDYDEGGRVLLPEVYRDWYESKPRHSSIDYAMNEQQEDSEIQILSPLSQAQFAIDPELPGGGKQLPLKASISTNLEWTSPTLRIHKTAAGFYAHLEEGTHVINLTDVCSGKTVSVTIYVKCI